MKFDLGNQKYINREKYKGIGRPKKSDYLSSDEVVDKFVWAVALPGMTFTITRQE